MFIAISLSQKSPSKELINFFKSLPGDPGRLLTKTPSSHHYCFFSDSIIFLTAPVMIGYLPFYDNMDHFKLGFGFYINRRKYFYFLETQACESTTDELSLSWG